jgi:putative colanic acid biosynthesis acetyltransferase WcaF
MLASHLRLDLFSSSNFDRGATRLKEALWVLVFGQIFSSFIPGSNWRARLLSAFGADVANGVVIKPHVRVKFPWRLKVGANSWLGEKVWIDNLVKVEIGANSCISQGAYLCTGSHDWSSERFDLILKPIIVEDYAWVAAFAKVGPGVRIRRGAILAFAGVATKDLDENVIYAGNPAIRVKSRSVPIEVP